jgi:hypothetical protein
MHREKSGHPTPFPKERSRAPLCFHARQQLNSHAKTPLRTQKPDSSLAPNPEHSFCNIHIHDDKEQNGIPQNAETVCSLPEFDLLHQTNGGAERDRTDDLLLAKQALSQLSYSPVVCDPIPDLAARDLIMVGLGRLELPTSRLSGVRSNHLSYRPG